MHQENIVDQRRGMLSVQSHSRAKLDIHLNLPGSDSVATVGEPAATSASTLSSISSRSSPSSTLSDLCLLGDIEIEEFGRP